MFYFYFCISSLRLSENEISICIEWWAYQDLNLGPTGYEPVALAN